MPHIAKRLEEIRATLPEGTTLVAVSKYHPVEAIAEAYACGQRVFGESRAQELLAKREQLPADIEWHFIGHLQRSSVKYIAPFITLIHAVDTPRLLCEINKQAARHQRVIDCLLELHVAAEETKHGFSVADCEAYLDGNEWRELPNVRICGLMCMATNTDDTQRIRSDFHTACECFQRVKQRHFSQAPHFRICSWGMTDDYRIALEEGSTMMRIGSGIFG